MLISTKENDGFCTFRVHFLEYGSSAEEVGFEPTVPCDTLVFKTSALDQLCDSSLVFPILLQYTHSVHCLQAVFCFLSYPQAGACVYFVWVYYVLSFFYPPISTVVRRPRSLLFFHHAPRCICIGFFMGKFSRSPRPVLLPHLLCYNQVILYMRARWVRAVSPALLTFTP